MRLKFKIERLEFLLKLKNLNYKECTDIIKKHFEQKDIRINIYNIINSKGNINYSKIEKIAIALGVPVGYFYYENVDVTMENSIVKISIAELKSEIEFPLGF